MILKILTGAQLFFFSLLLAPSDVIKGQACVLQAPVIHIDFGNGIVPVDPNLSLPENYERVNDHCPQDGSYAIVSSTGDCFGGHWITLNQDHTANDINGKMLLVNAAYKPGLFFVTDLKGLSPNTAYEVAAWIVNICKPGFDCTNNRPNLRFTIENAAGSEIAKFSTGEISPTGSVSWLQYSAMFRTPADVSSLVLKIINKEEGGCGNDFAMDDITIRECVLSNQPVKIAPKPIVKDEPKPARTLTQPVPVTKPVVKQTPPALKPVSKDNPVITKLPVNEPQETRTIIKEYPTIDIPKPILTRTNPIVKQIVTDAAEMVIDLYDNGEIDGDTVSIYHNNVLIVSRAGLTEKPITFHFAVDAKHPHHELVMVANNLGSIPPNTSLMIITTAGKRYEVFISSTEQQNAKVVIDLKSP